MSEPIPTDPVVDPDFPPEAPVPPEPEPVEPGPEMPVVKGWLDQIADAESRAAVEALRVATAEAEREAGEAEAAAKAYADLIDTGASDADIAAARAYAEEQAEEARIAAEAAAALDATAKADAAEQAAVVAAEADAAAKAAQAVTDAGAYTDAQIPLVAGRLVPRNMDRAPTVEDGADLIAGTGWNQYDPVTNDLVQMWRWDGAEWQALDMSAEMIPVLDIGSATVGDLTGDRINVTGTLSANIVDAMDVNAKKLVVTEEAILNHATLIGDTVVDNINVTGKLIGTDGVFTGTVDFENVNVTGLQLVEKLEANSISADLIEGGHFTGETFEGGSFVGGEFRTSDQLPGQVTLSDTGYTHSGTGVSRPGIRIDPEDSTGLAAAGGIGPIGDGFAIDGGQSTSGERTSITMRPGYSLIRADGSPAGKGVSDISVRPALAEVAVYNGGHRGAIQAAPGRVGLSATHPDGTNAAQAAADTLSARLRAYRTDGSRAGAVEATDTAATVSVRDATGKTRGSMEVSEAGATSRSFSGNASESGWVRARPQDAELAYVDPSNVYASRILTNASEASLYTSAGGTQRYLSVDADGIWARTNKGGSWKQYNLEETAQDSGWHSITLASGITGAGSPAWRNKGGVIYFRGTVNAAWVDGWNEVATNLPTEMRPEVRVIRTSPSTGGANLLFRMEPDGRLRFYRPGGGAVQGDLSGLFYPLG